MHDPLVLIFSIKVPWLRRYKPKMYLGRHGRRLGPIALVFVTVIDMWHREPGGRDAFEVCRRRIRVDEYRSSWRLRLDPFVRIHPGYSETWALDNRWKYHVHHWHPRVWPVFRIRRWLFVRCAECGRRPFRGEALISAGGDQVWHNGCHNLVHARRQLAADRESYVRFIRRMQGYLDWTDEDLLADAYQRQTKPNGYGVAADHFTVARLLGWEFDHDRDPFGRDDRYVLVHKPSGRETEPHHHTAPPIPTGARS